MKAVIMAGGQGTRFWPASRRAQPKQFLPIVGDNTLLQQTVARLQPLLAIEDIFVVTSQPYVGSIVSQLPELDASQIIIEPLPRNTAPCVGLSAWYLQQRFGDEIMAVLPADHIIQDTGGFHQALETASRLARHGWLVTFAMKPRFAATGYGYLEQGSALSELEDGTYRVARFVEKPDAKRARQFLKEPKYFWNSGMFVWSTTTILGSIEQHLPQLHKVLDSTDWLAGDSTTLRRAFEGLEKISVDYGIMERASRVAMVPCDLGWNDVGSWKSLLEVRAQDTDGHSSSTQVVSIDSSGCVVQAPQDKLVALLGIEDLILVETKDALLICPQARSEDVKKIVDLLERKGLEEYL